MQDLKDSRRQPLRLKHKTVIWHDFAQNCIKMKEIGLRAGARPLDSPMIEWLDWHDIINDFSKEVILSKHFMSLKIQMSRIFWLELTSENRFTITMTLRYILQYLK